MAAGSTYTPIATTTIGSTVTTYTFSSIPSTYTDLIIVATLKISGAGDNGISLRYNGDSGTNYSFTYLNGNGTSVASGRSSNQSYAQVGNISGDYYYPSIIHIMNYSNTTTYKTTVSKASLATYYQQAYTSLWRNTSAINQIEVRANGGADFVSGSTLTLYGITAA
jgi:hypothetical protein